MAIDDALNDLKAAYDKVAHEIEAKFPKAWAKANEMFGGEIVGAVHMLSKKPTPAWGTEVSLLDVAEKHGEDEVVNYLEAIMAGVYM